MAKALIGHLNSSPRSTSRLSAENHHLRARVADLEALVARLQRENDRLTAAQAAVILERETEALEQMAHA
jgi:tryptophanyl-tRNA synthetase